MGIFQQATLTNLRSLPYGHDTVGGGDSGEPYIITPLPPAEGPLPNAGPLLDLSYAGAGPIISGINLSAAGYNLGIDGGLMRGGFSGALLASKTDFVRIGKFLKDSPKGPLFLIKQVGLQLSNPQPEAPRGAGSFLNNLVQGNFSTLLGLDGGFSANIGDTRIYNGVNTLLEVPLNAFGGHITRHGLLPYQFDAQKYASIARDNDPLNIDEHGDNNNLVRLKNKLQSNQNANIASYISGPESVYGIGFTTINRFDNTLSNKQYLPEKVALEVNSKGRVKGNNENGGEIQYEIDSINPNYYNAQGVSLQYFDNDGKLIEDNNNILPPQEGRTNNSTENSQFGLNAIKYGDNKTYTTLKKAIDTQITSHNIGTVSHVTSPNRKEYTVFTPSGTSTHISRLTKKPLNLITNNIESRLGLSGASGHDPTNSKSDGVTSTSLYYSDTTNGNYATIDGQKTRIRDLIKFRMEAVDNDHPDQSVWMLFRAYLKDIVDTPNPSWNTVNYIGRGEPFYIYKGFERSISFTLQVAAMSEAELKPMWQKLNYLYSNTMPDYGDNNVMRAPYMKLTLGDYLFRQPGIIKNLTYTISNDSPWEIAIDEPESGGNLYELPHVMTIQMTFAPIHNFIPRKFPQNLPEPAPGKASWEQLPAFMGNRVSNQNQWLTDIFKDKQIPKPDFTSS
jgi:hypothetical protein